MPPTLGGTVPDVHKTTIYLPASTEERMRRAAKRLGRSRAEITRIAIDEYLDRNDVEPILPPSVGMGSNPNVHAADYKERLAEYRGRR
jgi:hypothetical protein